MRTGTAAASGERERRRDASDQRVLDLHAMWSCLRYVLNNGCGYLLWIGSSKLIRVFGE